MEPVKLIGKIGTDAVRKLRDEKLKNGLPFMINTKELPTNQCYLEYPNGIIKLITVIHATRNIDILRELTFIEANDLRSRFQFSSIK